MSQSTAEPHTQFMGALFALPLHLKILVEISIVGAGVLQNFPVRAQFKGYARVPWPRTRLRVFHGYVVLQCVMVCAAHALDYVQILAVAATLSLDPGLCFNPI